MKQLDTARVARLEDHIRTRLEKRILVGAVAGVWQDNEKKYGACLGMRDIERKLPMTEDTIFRLASMTKPVTGTAVMQQVERGKLALDDEVRRYLPGFAAMEVAVATPEGEILATRPAERPITVRMLLTHSSGLGSGPAGNAQYRRLGPPSHTGLDDAVADYGRCVLDFQPGTTQLYSAVMGMDVLARLVEIVSDTPYPDYLQKNIFDPLEMPDTGYRLRDDQKARLMEIYDAKGDSVRHCPLGADYGFNDFPPFYSGGGAGLFSTLEDYSHLARMFANNGAYKSERVLQPATVDAMATPQLPEEFSGLSRYFNWGLSMRVCPVQKAPAQPLTPGSFGWSGAYGTHFWVDREKHLYAVYMSNLADGGGAGAATAFEFERDVMHGFDECE